MSLTQAPAGALELQLRGYRLATAEITYRLPDHPSLLQTFVWQHYDLAPEFPELRRFLDFWATHIEGLPVQRQRRAHRAVDTAAPRPRGRDVAAPLIRSALQRHRAALSRQR